VDQELPKIETIAIGDELLTGKIADTNSAFVASHFFREGYPLTRCTVVADDFAKIETAIRESGARANFTIVFGGLGPTSDDKTAECIASLLQTSLVEHGPSKDHMEKVFKDRGRTVNEHSLKQVLYPKGTEPLPNPRGFAPGFRFRVGSSYFFCLPGVPEEMKALFLESVLPFVKSQWGNTEKVSARTWKCLGVPESELQKAMDPIEAILKPGEWLGYRTRFPENHLSLYCTTSRFDELSSKIAPLVNRWAYTDEDKELEDLVLEALKSRKEKLVLAESCTGGLVAHRLTQIPGASDSLWGSYVVYQPEAKRSMLGVALEKSRDAVSPETTEALAKRAKAASQADVAAAVTGYMGPTGEKVGQVFLHVESRKSRSKELSLFLRERTQLQWGAATWLLFELLQSLKED
jgi:nicotinamide-nucleotide amidase